MRKPGHIWLLGLSGSGKSTLGPILASQLKIPFHDTDEIIVQSTQRSIPEIFSIEGESGFRKREAEAIRGMAKQKPAVVSSGAGAILEADNRDWMQKTGTRIYLRTPLELLERRLRDKQDRPLLAQGSLLSVLTDQLSERESWYQESEIQIDAGDSSPAELAQQIGEILTAQT